MVASESYVELVNRVYSRSRQEGSRPYPVACYEIFLLAQAQQRAKQKETEVFLKLNDIFDWQLSRRQRNGYLKKLNAGFTLVLTDPSRTILWTSNNFLAMTGYAHAETVGQKPGLLLQGPGTDPKTIERVSEALFNALPVKADLLNYRKSGESYMCRVVIDPLYNTQGELTHFLAVECEVAV